jgi:RNA-directed DNA polymerase
VHVRTMRKRLRRSLKAVAQWCQEHMHDPVDAQQKTLNAKLRGHYQYYGRPTNYRGIWKFYQGPVYLAYVAQSPYSWGEDDVGEV